MCPSESPCWWCSTFSKVQNFRGRDLGAQYADWLSSRSIISTTIYSHNFQNITVIVSWNVTPHIQHTPSLNCCHLVDATELWAPERPDTGTVSSLRLSISWTLDIKRGTHNTIIHYSSHKLIFSFQICTYQTCTHIIVYIIYCVFAILYIAYLYICILFFYYLCLVLLLSFCCTVELLSL